MNKEETKLVYTKQMKDAGKSPEIGMFLTVRFLFGNTHWNSTLTYLGDGVGCYKTESGNEYTFDTGSVEFEYIDIRTDTEKASDDLDILGYKCNMSLINSIKDGKVRGISFTGSK